MSNIQNSNLNSNSNLNHNLQLNLRPRNSLVESNPIAKWTQDVFMKEMDKFAYLRQNIIFVVMFFYLGNNLNMYLHLFIAITIYMLVLRFIRWWVKRWLLFFFEFCYFGIVTLIVYLLFFPSNQELWITVFSYSSGNMAIATIILSNSAQFGSTDHISSVWLHITPIITCWCIRWREMIYSVEMLKYLKYDLVESNKVLEKEKLWFYFFVFPILFWCCWCVYYVTVFYGCFYANVERHPNCIADFKKFIGKAKILFKDNYNGIKWKYLMFHFINFVIGIPFAILCYYNFYFHLVFIIVLMFCVFYNAGLQQSKFVGKKVNKINNEDEVINNLAKNEEIKE